jgi:hypothetical protein
MPDVIYDECHIQGFYAECHYAECHYAERRSAKLSEAPYYVPL